MAAEVARQVSSLLSGGGSSEDCPTFGKRLETAGGDAAELAKSERWKFVMETTSACGYDGSVM